ncbi:MAG: hypothetical protein GX289_02920 [Tissierellia bacterium]|jgi:hypothetical protein|nr:hypothetical protein [Tissierellia bacterium]
MLIAVSPELVSSLNTFLNEYKFQIGGFLGIVVLTCLLALIYHISKLGVSGTNQNSRREAIKGILISGVGLAVLGSLSFWFYLIVGTNLII